MSDACARTQTVSSNDRNDATDAVQERSVRLRIHRDRMPLDRIQVLLASQRNHLATGTLVSLMECATTLAETVDGEHMKPLRAGQYICFDTLVTDAESRNKAGMPGVIFAYYNAHVVRKLKDARRIQPVLAAHGLRLYDALYDREEQAKSRGLRRDALARRRLESAPHAERLKQWMTDRSAKETCLRPT